MWHALTCQAAASRTSEAGYSKPVQENSTVPAGFPLSVGLRGHIMQSLTQQDQSEIVPICR